MSAAVAGPTAASTAAGSRQKLSRSMSANTGVAPARQTALADAAKENEGRITSSPGPIPMPSSARCSAEVPELTATQCRPSTSAENSFSNAATSGPCATMPERRTRSTAARSSSPIRGWAAGIMQGPPRVLGGLAGSALDPSLLPDLHDMRLRNRSVPVRRVPRAPPPARCRQAWPAWSRTAGYRLAPGPPTTHRAGQGAGDAGDAGAGAARSGLGQRLPWTRTAGRRCPARTDHRRRRAVPDADRRTHGTQRATGSVGGRVVRVTLVVLVVLVALVPVGVAAYRGARMSAHSADGAARLAGSRAETRWRCVEREIDAALPAGSRVTVPMDQPLLPYQRAIELAAPHLQVVSRAADADYELRLVPARQGGRCWNYR